MRNSILAVTAAFLLLACAGQRAPQGGPVDTDPPVILSTNPPNYTTHFSGTSLALEFSEYVDHRSVEGAIFISPSLGPLEFEWSGRELEIRFSEKLRRNTTYVVTVGTDVADLRNRNKMSSAYTLAFTTGEDIDHGAIEGRVYPRQDNDSPGGIMVFAYNLNGLNADTLDPRRTRPDYVTQTGTGGNFLLKHLSFGGYRLIAVRDDFKNLLYDPETDEYGIPSAQINLTPEDTMRSGIFIRLSREDTAAIRLLKVSAPDQHHLIAEFSAPIDTAHIALSWFYVVDTLSQKTLGLLSACPIYPKINSVLLVTEEQAVETPYKLGLDSLRGSSGLLISALARSLPFSGSAVRDSVGPVIVSCSLTDSLRGVALSPTITLDFSDAVKRGSAERSITVKDSGRVGIPLTFRWLSDASVQLKPEGRLASRVWYSLRVAMTQIVDWGGLKGAGDSVRVFRFQTIDAESFSSIEGVVSDTGVTDVGGDIVLVARQVATKEGKELTYRLGQAGPFFINEIPEGKYVLRAYRDRNGNAAYDFGQVIPYKLSERFTQYGDTLKVRARWPLEGVKLRLR
jgi:hypothetical protein